MPKFKVSDTMACMVTWEYEIEADDKDAAFQKYVNGDHGEAIGPTIGDTVEYVPQSLDCVELTGEKQ